MKKPLLRVLIYDKLDDEGRAIAGERRAYAAFSDQEAQQKFIDDAKLDTDRIKYDYFEGDLRELTESAQPDHICFALYKKWSNGGAFELSGYSYTKNFDDTAAGYDHFVMPILIDKTHEEMEAWKEAAMQARLGTGKALRDAKRALARLPEQEREKREAEFLTDFAGNAYKAFKPKTKRELVAVQSALVLAILWIAVMVFLVPEQPSAEESVGSVPWLPEATSVSYFRSPDLVVFECKVPWERAQSYIDAEFNPVSNGEFMRYSVYYPNANPHESQGLEMDADEFERWNERFKAIVREGYEAKLPDGSHFLYDSANGTLYGLAQGETRDSF